MKSFTAILVFLAAAASAQSCDPNALQVCEGNRIKFCNIARNNVFDVSILKFIRNSDLLTR